MLLESMFSVKFRCSSHAQQYILDNSLFTITMNTVPRPQCWDFLYPCAACELDILLVCMTHSVQRLPCMHAVCSHAKALRMLTWQEYLGSVLRSTAWPYPGTTLPDFSVLLAKSFTSSALGSSPSCTTEPACLVFVVPLHRFQL